MFRLLVVTAALLPLSGCCCCGFGGESEVSDDWVSKEIGERVLERVSGAEDVQIDEKGGTMTIRGPDGEAVIATDEKSGTLRISGKDGEFTFEGSETGTIPDDFPLTPYAGSKAEGVMRMAGPEGTAFILSLRSAGTVPEVAGHYEGQLKSKGCAEPSRIDATADGKRAITLTCEASGTGYMLVVADEGGQTLTAATVTPR